MATNKGNIMALTKEQMEIFTTLLASADHTNRPIVDEAMEVEDMFHRLNLLEEKLKANVPVCPHCLEEMQKTFFKGYYDERSYWACDCDFEKDETATRDTGCYA
jgi:hypothetical protein